MKRWSKRDAVIFFLGVEAFHTLTHIIIGFANVLPLEIIVNWTQELNMWAIGINAVITIGLAVWLAKLK